MHSERESSFIVDVQIASSDDNIPSNQSFERWVYATLPDEKKSSELTIRVVGPEESQALNNRYRHKNTPTNVLSFPSELPPEINIPLLGDIIICSAVVEREAIEHNKTIESHWAHMVIHGTLHLLGYDHDEEKQAQQMEQLETTILQKLGYCAPYTPA